MMIRGFMVDSARCLERRAYYRFIIDFMADRGMNTLLWHFTDDQGCTLQFDSVPGIASPNAYSKSEMRRLVKYAKSRGIDLVPEVASLGHSLYITRLPQYAHLNETQTVFTGICPVSDETRQVIRRLIEEAATVFDSPNFHVGLDEANFGEHPLTAEALKTRTRGDIFADHVNFVHSVVKGLGKRMWMWGDGVLQDPEVARRISREIVLCNWQYRPHAPTDSTQRLLDEGFDILLCPALISHDQPLFSSEQYALPNLRCIKGHEQVRGKGRILGSVCTIWTGVRFMSGTLWPAMHYAAAVMQSDQPVDLRRSQQSFARDFFGLDDAGAQIWSDLCQHAMELSPLRREWVPVGKGEIPDQMTPEQVESRGGQWRGIGASLRDLSPAVQKNKRPFATFRLMVEVLAHWHTLAARLGQTRPPADKQLERLYRKGENLLRRVERVWDRERFRDDPKKTTPAVEFFRDDHLLLLLKQGLVAAADRLPAEAAVA